MVKFYHDLGRYEELMQAPGEIEVIATIRVMTKNGKGYAELEADERISRRTVKKLLRRLSLEL